MNPLKYSTIICPILSFYVNLHNSHYDTFFSSLCLSISSILYHYQFKIKNIRKIDMMICIITFLQNLYLSIYYTQGSWIYYKFLNIPAIYFISYFSDYYSRNVSNVVHTIMHFYVLYSEYVINTYRKA